MLRCSMSRSVWIAFPEIVQQQESLVSLDLPLLLRRCHDRMHGLGAGGAEADLSMDMVRLLVSKVHAEQSSGSFDGPATIRASFAQVRAAHPDVFGAAEVITVSDAALAAVAEILGPIRLIDPSDPDAQWQMLGQAYEEYTSAHLKRQRGQFFTQRRVVELVVGLLDPRAGDRVLDPAAGSGGFLSGVLRHVRASGGEPELHMVEASPRLVKVARASMILHGAPDGGLMAGDGLAPWSEMVSTCGSGSAQRVLSNPPFAGTGDGRITESTVLSRFRSGHRWVMEQGVPTQTDSLLSEGAPPELLFLERCIDWLAPGGWLGIVLPKAVLDTRTYLAGRALLFEQTDLRGVITLHRHAFQPHTGVQTCIIVAQKRSPGAASSGSPVFMAQSRRAGQDSEGRTVYRRDSTGVLTEAVDEDLGEIMEAWRDHLSDRLEPSEYRFTVDPAELGSELRINPQAFRPSLNATLTRVEAVDARPGWRVLRLAELHPELRIFKGPRLRSDNIVVDEDHAGPAEPYYTPGAVLQEKCESAKRFDLSRATASQRRVIETIRVRQGDIVISRSGAIGRVSWIGSRFDGAIVSDDLIRIRLPDERMRLYLYSFLQSRLAQDQMLRNEYGSIQQHLEPHHVGDVVVPIPDDWSEVQTTLDSTRALIEAKEALHSRSQEAESHAQAMWSGLIAD